MRKTLLIILNFIIFNLSAQNLVLNPSFEDIVNCYSGFMLPPPIMNSDTGLLFWTAPSYSSPNLHCKCYDACGSDMDSIVFNVPKNNAGYQMPHSGNNYAGFGVYWQPGNPNYREYIQGKLSQQLINNKKYKIFFFLSLADTSCYAIKSMGINFSPDERFYPIFYQVINIVPQLVCNHFLADKSNWMQVSFDYIATGGEQYFIIGNFNNDINTDTLLLKLPINQIENGTYYYIDDVSVVFNDTIYKANAGRDTAFCRGNSAVLGTHNFSDYKYKWYPSTGLNNDTLANPMATPSVTTTYTLELKDFFDTLTYDTVLVQVIPCEPANAGEDQTVCKGKSVELGTHNYEGYTYSWSPSNGLNEVNIALPKASPTVTITYTLTVIDLQQITTTDNVCITVKDCDTIIKEIVIPNVFTPNSDGYNDYFVIENIQPNTSLIIFNRWGDKVYETTNYQNDWNAKDVSAGVYFYILKPSKNKAKQGVVEVLK